MAASASICAFLKESGHIYTKNDGSVWNITEFVHNFEEVSLLNKITYAYIAPIIITFGIVGDFLTVVSLTHPLLRKASIVYTYLTLLAMTDLLSLFSVIPMILYFLNIRFCSQIAALYYAHIGFPLVNALMGASVWIVVCLTLSQYMAVCHPFYHGVLRKRKCCYWMFAGIYIFSFSINALWAVKKNVHIVPDGLTECTYNVCDGSIQDSTWFKIYEWIRELVTRGCPFLIIAYCNAKILTTYRKTKKERLRSLTSPHQNKNIHEKSEQEEKRLFLLLFTIVIIFMICTIPAAPLTIFVSDARQSELGFQIFRAITNLLEFTKFALNFYFYCLINPEIRIICYHIVCCKKLNKQAMVKGQPVTFYSRNKKNIKHGSLVDTKILTLKNNGKGEFLRSKSLSVNNNIKIIKNNFDTISMKKKNEKNNPFPVTESYNKCFKSDEKNYLEKEIPIMDDENILQ
ncbi:G protein-coupled receptor, rhodopsin-like family and GPCR, rhodopsin-like, 7TM domain-containing protein [Strongyloides ratti]|uniref:G protein-coupled receptor, rhodopsin-like family and GPCR, rhodopsin-like, 7TM domain-containing protein n=1 Tax=Strongyloides ratti TaxID=34506 RepID=A0A090KUX6_STRRB|nr:G protein-coupled receptor, rhodopsin-like family and GPCR, rhodopsin-like, 7TM domain-containing protein [Strongyloides ratti]CEF61310.1 G protein-coupled receptor, rhodopsin-like family and GPCR, rhodopsin-like, 7TM domain-containing protein [Strongyloides ratti]